MKKQLLYISILSLLLSGCTQIITAPIGIATSVVGGTIDVAGSAIGAVIPDGDEDKKD